MPKIKRKRVGDVGIRLKPVENNLLENYNEFSKRRKKTRKKKKKKIKKPKRTVTKSVEIHDKVDPLYKIMEESKGKPKEEIEVKELPDIDKPDKIKKPDIDKPDKEKKPDIHVSENIEVEEPQFKKIQVHEGKADITKKDPNIKTLNITASLEPEKKKKGGGILLE
tara:strand:- start:1656 stop:2153 length:498 start_codon:yes stop_codon:yes gene_type:complete